METEKLSFEAAYETYYEPICNYIMSHVGQYEAAQDLTQNVFEAAWRHWQSYDPACGGVRPWLYCIAKNLLKNYYRDAKPTVSLDELHESGAPDPADDAMRGAQELLAQRDALAAALKALPEQHRRIIILRYFGGRTNQEIADMLNMSNGNVRVTLARGLQKLHDILNANGFSLEE